MNLTASRTLNWKAPLQCLTDQVPDTSIFMLFEFYDEVYFKHPADASDDNTSYPARLTEKKGYFVGFSKHVGRALTYKILTNDTRKVLHRSVICRASDQRNLQIDPDFRPTQTATPDFLTSPNDDALREGRSLPTINPVDADSVFEQVEKENGEHADSSDDEDEPPPLVRRPDDSDDEDESPYAARRPGEEADSDDEDDTPIPVAS
jgi:hypothetical protein